MLLDEVAVYLETLNVGTRAVDLFTGFMPDTPDALVVILEVPGRLPSRDHGTPGVALEHPQIAVWARGIRRDYQNPRLKAQAAHDALSLVTNMLLSAVRYLDIMPMQQPFLVERDKDERSIIGFNAAVTKVP